MAAGVESTPSSSEIGALRLWEEGGAAGLETGALTGVGGSESLLLSIGGAFVCQ